jgi:UDP-N-acetylmuramoyl-L-alanyl-D-glutamate--2,6-diaminopimelate ligase
VPIPGGPRPDHVVPRPLGEVLGRLGLPAGGPDAAGPLVTGVTLSSRAVRPGDLYAALPGARTHGAEYAAEAARAGAVAVLTDEEGASRAVRALGEAVLPVVVVPDPRAVLGELAAWVYGDPAAKLLTLGVTGTNGKTTTTSMLDAALRAAGRRTGLVGTVELRLGDERIPSTGTTPEAPDLHALLAVMVERGVTVCSMEISSHALALHRVDGLVVDVAAFTNLSQDHLDFHGTMEEYFAAKASLFTPERARRGVVCVDDDAGARLASILAGVPVTTVSTVADRPADWSVLDERIEAGLPVARVTGPGVAELELRSPLPGRFNLANALVALAVLVEAGLDAEQAAKALAAAGPVPGRMERVGAPGRPAGAPLAVVDFAHSPDAVDQALAALRTTAPAGEPGRPLVVVLGAGGDRDRDKRPLMGAAAARGADVVVVTDDNPRSEDPAAIRAAVVEGARAAARDTGAEVVEVAGRREAIAHAVRRAWGGGVVLVAGKGHEQGQEVAGVVHPFDDRSALRAALDDAAAPTAPTAPPAPTQEAAR